MNTRRSFFAALLTAGTSLWAAPNKKQEPPEYRGQVILMPLFQSGYAPILWLYRDRETEFVLRDDVSIIGWTYVGEAINQQRFFKEPIKLVKGQRLYIPKNKIAVRGLGKATLGLDD